MTKYDFGNAGNIGRPLIIGSSQSPSSEITGIMNH
jgi:hypothetical protein